jgi:predicted transcriptional regulator
MKTAISLPDDLFRAIDARARSLKISRSGLIARAATEFLARQAAPADATDAWNRALARGGQPDDEPASVAFRKRTRRIIGAAIRSGR